MNTRYFKPILVLVATAMLLPGYAAPQSKDEFNPIETGVTSLSIAPDARGASMGDLGAATDPDVNSQFWNPSKYAFAYSQAGVSLSYTPWLRKIVNDIFLANLSGYWKLGGYDNQAISASLRYFSLGEVNTSGEGSTGQSLNPYELSFDVGYSRKLSEKFSMGVVLRYIYSDLGFSSSYAGDQSTGASAFSVDVSGYYTTYPIIGRNECQWSWGWDISNVGSKVSFNNGENPAFLPTNLRLGTSFMFPLADYHTLALSLDLNKLLVPAKPRKMTIQTLRKVSSNILTLLKSGKTCRLSPVYSSRLPTLQEEPRKSSAKSRCQSVPSTATTSSFSCARAIITKTSSREAESISAWEPDSR